MDVRWAGDSLTWEQADDATREKWALTRLFWFYRMVASGGPDGSSLDAEVADQAREAAGWYGPRLKALAERAGQS